METIAMVLLAFWVIGLVTGNSLGGAIHVLLLAGLAALFLHNRAASRARSISLIGTSRAMATAMRGAAPARKPAPTARSRSAKASRPSAAA